MSGYCKSLLFPGRKLGMQKNSFIHKAILKNDSPYKLRKKNVISKATLQQKNKDGLTPLPLALQIRNYSFFKILLLFEKDAIDYDGLTALHIASIVGNSPAYNKLRIYYNNLNIKDNDEWTPLHWAVQKGNELIVKKLLQGGANPNSKDRDQITPLYIVITEGRQKIFTYLINAGGDINQKVNDETLLHIACAWNKMWVIKKLLSYGLSIYAKDNDGITPYDIAINNNYKSMIKFFASL